MFVFLTELFDQDVVDRFGRWVGRPHDFVAKIGEPYPRLTDLIVQKSRVPTRFAVVPWTNLQYTANRFELKQASEGVTFRSDYHQPNTLTLRRNILDQQVVDTFNRKVVRVNDLHLLSVDGELRLAHVDVGLRGLVRRLGWEGVIDWLVRLLSRHAGYLSEQSFISWKYVQPLSVYDPSGRIQLNVEQETLRHIPPPDISEMLMELDPYQRAALLKTLEVQRQVDIITELDLKLQKDMIEDLDTRAAVELFEKMPADEATDLLQVLSERDVQRIMPQISTRKVRELNALMSHGSDSAGGLMTTEFVAVTEAMTIGAVIEHIRTFGGRAETLHCSYVVDAEQRLIGMISMRTILLESNDKTVAEVMLKKPPAILVEDSLRDVATTFDKYNSFVLPVVDDAGKLVGIITIDDILSRVINRAWEERAGL